MGGDLKTKRRTMWWLSIIFLAITPLLVKCDGRQVSEDDLVTIPNLVLTEDGYYHKGSGRFNPTAFRLHVTATEKTIHVIEKYLRCMSPESFVGVFKQGDTISIRIDKDDLEEFYDPDAFKRNIIISGLIKNEVDYTISSALWWTFNGDSITAEFLEGGRCAVFKKMSKSFMKTVQVQEYSYNSAPLVGEGGRIFFCETEEIFRIQDWIS